MPSHCHRETCSNAWDKTTDLSIDVDEDPILKMTKLMECPSEYPTQPPHHLLRHHPLWAGVLILWLQLSRWDATIEMVRHLHDT